MLMSMAMSIPVPVCMQNALTTPVSMTISRCLMYPCQCMAMSPALSLSLSL